MNNNRYAPPVADVIDVADEARAPRPLQVVWAVRVLWATTVLSIPQMHLEAERAHSGHALVASLVFEAVMTAFACYMYVCIYQGRNWARIVTLIFTVLGTAMVVFAPDPHGLSNLEFVCTWLNTVADVACMCLLFTAAGSRWFKREPGSPS